MADITAAMVKDLREKSGAGMMDCKKALNETARRHGRRDRLAAHQGPRRRRRRSRAAPRPRAWSASPTSGTKGAAVEVNSETDFVAKNDQFQQFVREVTQIALATGGDVEALKAEAMPSGTTVADVLTNNIATIGENQSLRRAKRLEVSQGRGRAATSTTSVARPRARSACSSRSSRDASDEVLQGARQAARDAHRRGVPQGAERGRPRRGRDRARARDRDREGGRERQARRHHRQDGRGRHRQVPQGARAGQPAVRDGRQDQDLRRRRQGGQGRRHDRSS